MQMFYKKAWQVLFTIFYPFITLFSLLFIGLVSLISAVSRLITSPLEKKEEQEVAVSPDWHVFAEAHGLALRRLPVHEVQFGPLIYKLQSTPAIEALESSYWSDFVVPAGNGFLLQRWPSIEEHELEYFELVFVKAGSQTPVLLHTMPTFYWQVQPTADGGITLIWNEKEEKRLHLTAAQLL